MSLVIHPATVHHGVCDASAAVFLNDGSTKFLVADDEDQTHSILRLYDAAESGSPLAEHHLSTEVLNADPQDPEIDIEGSAWSGNRIFWIASHSRNRKGKYRPSRHRLFATEVRDGVPVVVGRPYSTLVRDVSRLIDFDLDPELPPKEGGISIEGLASTPRPGQLLIAFRSPLVRKKAMVVMLKNADAVVDSGAPAKFSDPVFLDLGGCGIRSLEYWPERYCYLILSGPAGSKSGGFAVMRWSGPISRHPELLDVNVEIEGGACEGLLVHQPTQTVYVLYDEGNRLVDGVRCKECPKKSFRSIAITGLL